MYCFLHVELNILIIIIKFKFMFFLQKCQALENGHNLWKIIFLALFVKAYQAKDRSKIEDERWNRFSREEIRQFDNSLDIGLIVDKSLPVYESLPNPIDVVEETISK